MFLLCLFGILSTIVGLSSATGVCKGCITIDEHSFDKILPRFEVILLKFDNSYPFGEEHNTFTKVAADIADTKNFIIGQVGIKYYGDNENAEFAKRFGIESKNDFPALRLFVQGEDEPFVYSNKMPWTEDAIKKFIRDHTNIYLGLPGCLETFDKLGMKFASSSDHEAVLKEAEDEAAKITAQREKDTAQIYIKYMKKVIENGISFVAKEEKRLQKILDGKVNEKKKTELSQRLNILRSLEQPRKKTEL